MSVEKLHANLHSMSPTAVIPLHPSAGDPRAPRKQPRRGHTKSRRGCLNCKRRRVKCQETLPECGHCKRLGLDCQYPDNSASRTPSPSFALQSTPTQFSMEDLRFFHHFLLFAYPGLPLGGCSVWQEVAKLSHTYDFLMHAMLGLAASHLTVCQGGKHSIEALTHRVKAVRLLKSAPFFSGAEPDQPAASSWSLPESDAYFATSMALAFQASYMPDGMDEFLWMIRGCILVMGNGINLEDSVFRAFSTEEHMQSVSALNQGRSLTHEQAKELNAAIVSVRRLRPLCQSTMQVTHLAALEKMLRTAKTSFVDAFNLISLFYDTLGEPTNEDFHSLMDSSNYASRIMLAHFFAIEYMTGEVALEAVIDSFNFRQRVIGDWVIGIAEALPPSYRSYVTWPLQFSMAAQHGLGDVKVQVLE